MKKFYCLFLLLSAFLFIADGFAQYTIIGPGQYSATTYGPMRTTTTANQNARFAYIYPASVLGVLEHGDTIRSVEFDRTNTNAMTGTVNFKIYIGTTALENWGSTAILWDTTITKGTLLYNANPAADVGSSEGFKKFTFSTPFMYDTTNGKNLIILCEYSQVEAQTATINWLYDNSVGVPGFAANQTKYASGTTMPSSLSSTNERHPRIKINFPLPDDPGVMSISPSGPSYYAPGTTSIPMTGFVINDGLNNATFTVTRTIFDGASSVYTNTQNVTNLAPGASQEVTFSSFTGFTAGTLYSIRDSVFMASDNNPLNNVMEVTFTPLIAKPVAFVYSGASTNERGNRDSVMAALNSYGLVYDTLNRENGLLNYNAFSTIIWADENSLIASEKNAIISFLNSGTELNEKSLIIAGDDIGYGNNTDTVFFANYLHARYFMDDGNGTPDASRICGEIINPGLCDSIVSTYPDGIGTYNGSQVAYRFADLPSTSDTVVGVVFDGAAYNVAYYGFEFREIVTSVTEGVNQIMNGTLAWVMAAGGTIPVEFSAFTASASGNNVTLNWSTATETNNLGFAVERRISGKDFNQIAFVKGKGTTTEKSDYLYTDSKLASGIYTYRLKQMDADGTFKYSNEVTAEVDVPRVFSLEQNYPNPFNPVTRIKYEVPVDGLVNLAVYNILGEKIATLVQESVKAGAYEIDFNGTALSSGVYFYRLESGDFVSIKKMMLLK